MAITKICGGLLIDKPGGITSAGVLRRIKRILAERGLRYEDGSVLRIGHTGTLDPMATGLLVVLLGSATKVQAVLTGHDKEYSGTIKLGLATDTDDITGREVGSSSIPSLSREVLDKIESHFLAAKSQMPPQYSAIRVEGRRAYAQARKGEAVRLASRSVLLRSLKLELEGTDTLRYHLKSSSGFYVRSLARDIGKALGTFGTLASIRRLSSSHLDISSASELEDLVDYQSIVSRTIGLEGLLPFAKRFNWNENDCRVLLSGNYGVLSREQVARPDGLSDSAFIFNDTNNVVALLAPKAVLLTAPSSNQGPALCANLTPENLTWQVTAVFPA